MGVNYTSPNPKFDDHMKKFDKKNMTPDQIKKHLNKGVEIYKKAKNKTNSVNA